MFNILLVFFSLSLSSGLYYLGKCICYKTCDDSMMLLVLFIVYYYLSCSGSSCAVYYQLPIPNYQSLITNP